MSSFLCPRVPLCLKPVAKTPRRFGKASDVKQCQVTTRGPWQKGRIGWVPRSHSSSRSTRCQAAESKAEVVTSEAEEPEEEAEVVIAESASEEGWQRTAWLGVLFAGWYSANVMFNIFNKVVLRSYPCPITFTCLQFGVGSLMVLLGWAVRAIKIPQMDRSKWTAILPLAVVHCLGNSFTNLSLNQVAVTFTHTIKAMEPFFSVVLSSLFLGERPTLLILLALCPIVGGVAVASLSEVSFNWTGFLSAMGSNLTFQSRNVLSKKTMGTAKLELDNISLFSLITVASFLICLPFAVVLEGDMYSVTRLRAFGIVKPVRFFARAVYAGFFFHLYQQVSYMILQRVSPVTHSIGNCIKRVVVIVASVIYFRNPMPLQNKIGTAVALAGVFLYSQAKRASKKKAS